MPLSLSRWSALVGALAFLPMPLAAQVRADVNVHVGPRAPREVVVVRSAPARRVMAPRVIVVNRVRGRHDVVRPARWWSQRGYRATQVYYDGGRYYDRRFDSRTPVRVVVVYERGGRYYQDWDSRYGRDNRYDRRDQYDRHDRDDRYYDDD